MIIIFKAFLVSKKLLKETCGYKTPVCDRLNKTSTTKHKQITFRKFKFVDHLIREMLAFTADFLNYILTNISYSLRMFSKFLHEI